MTLFEPTAVRAWSQTRASVGRGGQFRAGPLGPSEGLPDGVYRASAQMTPMGAQPEAVRAAFGADGAGLRGPLVTPGRYGPVVEAGRDVAVGGPDGAARQLRRLGDEATDLEGVYRDASRVFDRRTQSRLDGEEAGTRGGGPKAAAEVKGLLDRVKAYPFSYRQFALVSAVSKLDYMLHVAGRDVGEGSVDAGTAAEVFGEVMAEAQDELKEFRNRLDGARSGRAGRGTTSEPPTRFPGGEVPRSADAGTLAGAARLVFRAKAFEQTGDADAARDAYWDLVRQNPRNTLAVDALRRMGWPAEPPAVPAPVRPRSRHTRFSQAQSFRHLREQSARRHRFSMKRPVRLSSTVLGRRQSSRVRITVFWVVDLIRSVPLFA